MFENDQLQHPQEQRSATLRHGQGNASGCGCQLDMQQTHIQPKVLESVRNILLKGSSKMRLCLNEPTQHLDWYRDGVLGNPAPVLLRHVRQHVLRKLREGHAASPGPILQPTPKRSHMKSALEQSIQLARAADVAHAWEDVDVGIVNEAHL